MATITAATKSAQFYRITASLTTGGTHERNYTAIPPGDLTADAWEAQILTEFTAECERIEGDAVRVDLAAWRDKTPKQARDAARDKLPKD